MCLARGSQILAARTGDPNLSQSALLLEQIEQIFVEANCQIRDVELFAAAIGPGSFTGLRIGLATVKAFAATLERTCIGVPTLDAVAHHAAATTARNARSTTMVTMLPAGRGEVFWQTFESNKSGAVCASSNPGHLKPQELTERLVNSRVLKWAGDGARLHAALIKEVAHGEGLSFFDEATEDAASFIAEDERNVWRLARPVNVLAKHVSALALERYREGTACAPEALQAMYVRLSDAEIKQQCRA